MLKKITFLFSLIIVLGIFSYLTPSVLGSYSNIFTVNISKINATLDPFQNSITDFIVSYDPSFISNPIYHDYYIIKENSSCDEYDADGYCITAPLDLCPYISLNPNNEENTEHGGGYSDGYIGIVASGQLDAPTDITDKWKLSITSPCFKGQCPDDYDSNKYGKPIPQSLRGQTFSCMLEVKSPYSLVNNYIKSNTAYAVTNEPKNIIEVSAVLTGGTAFKHNPVLFIPGVLGTEMFDGGGNKLWLDLGHNLTDFGDQFMDSLQFNSNLNPSDSGVNFGDVIKREIVDLGVGVATLYNYTFGLTEEFKNQGYVEGTDLFLFPYDWRYGVNEDNVNKLKQKIQDILTQTGSDKVDIIAHSTGGLLFKKYVIENPSDNHADKAIFVGVPNLGAPKAIKVLLKGDNFSIPFLADSEMQKIGKNLPVIYDLAPSQQYYDSLGSYLRVGVFNISTPSHKDLSHSQVTDYLRNNNFNAQALSNADILHSVNFDNYDLRNNGIDLYNIVGCKSGTMGQILDMQDIDGNHLSYTPNPDHEFSGDGTVPFGSADSIVTDSGHTFFAPKADHGEMPSQDGIKQEIVNLISGSNLSTNGKILGHDAVQANPKLCAIKGDSINIKSPVNIGVTDQSGNFSGISSGGSIQNDIPGADYEVWGEHKYVFLPTDEGQTYTINLKGTGNGTFTLDDQTIDNDNITQTQVFSNIPVTTDLVGKVNLGNTTTLSLDNNNDGTTDLILSPSSIIDANQSQDLISPLTTSTITGTQGQPNFYRTDVSINLKAADPLITGQENQTSGILKTVYNLDNTGTQTYTAPITINTEGSHTITFFSTDRAGNNEEEKSISFTIDKTSPELSIQFNPTVQDLQFSGTDNITNSSNLSLNDKDDTITLTDQAGNITEMKLKNKDRQHLLKAEIKSLSYNGKVVDISKNELSFIWLFDKSKKLIALSQHVRNKKDFNIYAEYLLNKTILLGKDQNGKINKTLNGLTLLKISTLKGDLGWSY